jgi:hypothetical protein
MKSIKLLMFAALMMVLSSCSVISGIFKAGVAVGILAVVVVVAIVIWIIAKIAGK